MKKVRKTSINCFYEKVNKIKAKLYKRIVDTIEREGKDGLTRGEIAILSDMEKSTVSARVNELLKMGCLYEDGTRKDKFTNITAHIIKIDNQKLFY